MTHSYDSSHTFNRLRPSLHGIAFRMLGSTAEAEDVVQGAWLRWQEAEHHVRDHAEDWLALVTTRLAVRRLQTVRAETAQFSRSWLPTPLFGDMPPSTDQVCENVENITIAFLTLLDHLSPKARAAFLMTEVFGADFGEVAITLATSEPACRQLVHCAKLQLLEKHTRSMVVRTRHLRLLRGFAAASERGDIAMLKAMLTEDAELVGYRSSNAQRVRRPLRGSDRIARLYVATRKRYGSLLRIRLAPINGEWRLLRFIDGVLESAQSLETDGARIVRIHAQCNPEKLARLSSMLSAP